MNQLTRNLNAPLIRLEDGREFPQYNGEVLSWDLALSDHDAIEGYPRFHAVLDAMAAHRPEQLVREYIEGQRYCFGHNIFCGNARRSFNELVKGMLRNGITEIPTIFGPIPVKEWK